MTKLLAYKKKNPRHKPGFRTKVGKSNLLFTLPEYTKYVHVLKCMENNPIACIKKDRSIVQLEIEAEKCLKNVHPPKCYSVFTQTYTANISFPLQTSRSFFLRSF